MNPIFRHPNHRQPDPRWQRDFVAFDGDIATCRVEGFTGECGHQDDLSKPGPNGRLLAGIENLATDPAPGRVRVNEERSNSCRFGCGIQSRIIGGSAVVAPVEPTSPAPTAAPDDPAGVLDDEVGAVAYELTVDGEDRPERGLDLRIPTMIGHLFRSKSDSDSDSFRTPVTIQSGHRFRRDIGHFWGCPVIVSDLPRYGVRIGSEQVSDLRRNGRPV